MPTIIFFKKSAWIFAFENIPFFCIDVMQETKKIAVDLSARKKKKKVKLAKINADECFISYNNSRRKSPSLLCHCFIILCCTCVSYLTMSSRLQLVVSLDLTLL